VSVDEIPAVCLEEDLIAIFRLSPREPMDSHELDSKIAALEDTLREPLFGGPRRDGQFWRGVWNQIRDVGRGFRATRHPAKAEKDAAWSRYSSIVDGVKSRRDY